MPRETSNGIPAQIKRTLSGIAWGAAATIAVAMILVLGVWLMEGRSPAERAMTSLVLPVAMLWQFSFFLAVAAWRWKRRGWSLFAIVLWTFAGVLFNGNVAGAFLRVLEYPTPTDPAGKITDPLNAVVLLGGFAAKNRFGIPELNGDGQRLVLAAQLWHAGKTRSIICTGTGPEPTGDPSELGRRMLVSLGVPDEVIFEVSGPNTAAEMDNLKKYFADPPDDWSEVAGLINGTASPQGQPRIGLITNVVHMSRAIRLATARGLDFVPLPCRLRGNAETSFSLRDLIPTAGAGEVFATVQKEWMAYLVGR